VVAITHQQLRCAAVGLTLMSRVDSHQPGSTVASMEECRLCGREGMDNSAIPVEPQYCPVCIEELGHYLRSEATQPTKGHDERLLNNLKSLLGGSSLVSIRWVALNLIALGDPSQLRTVAGRSEYEEEVNAENCCH
jgi:hypothetical protein